MRDISFAMGRALLALFSSACTIAIAVGLTPVVAQAQDQAGSEVIQEVIVTGYRASLENATNAKRESTNFSDSVFAEDIGKFPDLNIAESLNRIPGIQLTREINGDGVNIAIRGLGTNFTKVVLNGSQIAVGSTGTTDSQNQNREVDLDLFPTELFTRLDVNKTPMPSMIEGGVAGTVNMRSARPFDHPGTQFSYQFQEGYGSISEAYSPRGAITGSWTNDTFGVLVGVAGVHNKSTTVGYETIGWTNMTVNYGLCGTTPPSGTPITAVAPTCNTTGGNGWGPPNVNGTTGLGSVPTNAGAGLVAGTTIDRAYLEGLNPGLTLEQISNSIIPRLGRESHSSGKRDRISTLLSFEFRPSDDMHFYLDTLYAKAKREFSRIDMNLVGRNGGIIPVGLQVDENGVVTSGTFANAQFFLEARPYKEDVNFLNINPGVHYQMNDSVGIDFQLNKSRSWFFRESPTVLLNSPLNQGVSVAYSNEGGNFPTTELTNFDLNDPDAGWVWAGGRVNIQDEKRNTSTQGGHLDVTFGEDRKNVRVGAAFDDVRRRIAALDNSRAWQQEICGGGGAFIPAPAAAPPCNGQAGSAVPQGELANYLLPGPDGFITVDYDAIKAASGYAAFNAAAPLAATSNTAARSGDIQEKTWGGYVELNGEAEVLSRPMRFNVGVRYVTTDQLIISPRTAGGVIVGTQSVPTDYNSFLPAFNAAWNLRDDIILRTSASRTLTRADPSAMLPNTTFSDVSAQTANQGNPALSPFISNNFDIGGEWYTGQEGYVGLTLFHKELNGFTVQGTTTLPFLALGIPFETLTQQQQDAINSRGGPNGATVNVTQQVNAGGTLLVQGYELIWVQPLNMVTQGLGFTANYTRVSQESRGPGVPAVAVGISPFTYNVTAYYENHGASIRLSYVKNDDQITSNLNEQGIALARRFFDARGQFDLSASYEFKSLPTSPQLTLNVINLTNEHQRSTFQYPNATFTFYDPGYQILLGLRGKF